VFAAGADLRLLADKGSGEVRDLDFPELWRPIAECPKPVIASVSGLALGAGCELAMMCDIVVADPAASFGQPEIRVGIMPGPGGRRGSAARRRHGAGASRIPAAVRQRRPEGGDGGLPGEAQTRLRGPLTWRRSGSSARASWGGALSSSSRRRVTRSDCSMPIP